MFIAATRFSIARYVFHYCFRYYIDTYYYAVIRFISAFHDTMLRYAIRLLLTLRYADALLMLLRLSFTMPCCRYVCFAAASMSLPPPAAALRCL